MRGPRGARSLLVLALAAGSLQCVNQRSPGRDVRADGKDKMVLEDRVRKRIDAAEIIFVGQPVRLHEAPAGWSGRVIFFQKVDYRLVRALKGQPPAAQGTIAVSHMVVSGSKTAASDKPGLSPALFRQDQSLLVLARADQGEIYALDENDSVMPATDELIDAVQRQAGPPQR